MTHGRLHGAQRSATSGGGCGAIYGTANTRRREEGEDIFGEEQEGRVGARGQRVKERKERKEGGERRGSQREAKWRKE